MKHSGKLGFALALFALAAWNAGAQQAGDPSQATPNAATSKDSADTAGKPKKVWTDDDVRHGAAGTANTKPAANLKPANPKDSQATKLKEQLAKLQAQLGDTDAKIAELQKFNGDNAPDTAIKLHQRLDRTSITEQIAKLEARKKQLQEQIQGIYDQARRAGIEPGALR